MPDVRVMLVDDHEVVRQGLASLLNRREHLRIVAEADSVATALAQVARTHPNVIIMDVDLPDGSGLDACYAIHAQQSEVGIIIFGEQDDLSARVAARAAGAAGYLLKGAHSGEVIHAIHAVASGASLFTATDAQHVASRAYTSQATPSDRLSNLTDRQRHILELIMLGKTNREIAAITSLSEKTVKNYVSALLHRLGLHRRSQAAALLARQSAWDMVNGSQVAQGPASLP
jgi:two-component system response regulator DevR